MIPSLFFPFYNFSNTVSGFSHAQGCQKEKGFNKHMHDMPYNWNKNPIRQQQIGSFFVQLNSNFSIRFDFAKAEKKEMKETSYPMYTSCTTRDSRLVFSFQCSIFNAMRFNSTNVKKNSHTSASQLHT